MGVVVYKYGGIFGWWWWYIKERGEREVMLGFYGEGWTAI